MRRVVVALAIVGLLMAGCGPAVMPAAAPETESGEQFVIALPRIVVVYGEDGIPSLEGLDLQSLAQSVGFNLDLSAYRMDPAYINWMQVSNIQHFELRQTGSGLAMMVNGKLLPHVSWQDGSLEATGGFVKMLGPQYEQLGNLVAKLAPIAKRLGLSIVVKFPVAAGADEIALATDDVVMATPAPANGPASALVQFEIKYDDQGVPSIMGISARDLANAGINAPLALAPSFIQQAQASNVQFLQLRSKGDGLYLYVNGMPLPGIAWDQVMLQNTLDAAQRMYAHMPIDWNIVTQLVPLLSNTDVSILIHLPRAEGVDAIPVKMQ
ncbi:MAG: hypothetical protein BWY52_01275 [Chloroflexi bacterium ADurb.Bin325]|nr:MAG: hypothetical protein BWY52_01275 [Chloroflexi bacterium ADurb.Bin325]